MSFYLRAAAFGSFVLLLACGDNGALTPDDVAPMPLGGDPAVQCPAGFASSAPAAGLNQGFVSGGQDREFVLLLPPASFVGPRPLMVGFNGTGGDGESFVQSAQLQDFADRGFIVLAPSSNGNGTVWPVWDGLRPAEQRDAPNLDVSFFDDLLACVGAHLDIDANRIYVTGHSAGGIFVNALLRRRSALLAGGVVASGVYDLTEPPEAAALDAMFVIVTWGGDNDAFSNSDLPTLNFVEQASQASQRYDEDPSVAEVNCRPIADQGHRYLPINDWVIDQLLSHPKGLPGEDGQLALNSVPSDYQCSDAPFVYVPPLQVMCGPSSTADCQSFCQYTADCAVENGTVGEVIGPQLTMAGFSGPENTECAGCVSKCEADATTSADAEVLRCLATEATTNVCGTGIVGFGPYARAVDGCCQGRSDSPWCVGYCNLLLTNNLAASFFPNCVALNQ